MFCEEINVTDYFFLCHHSRSFVFSRSKIGKFSLSIDHGIRPCNSICHAHAMTGCSIKKIDYITDVYNLYKSLGDSHDSLILLLLLILPLANSRMNISGEN